LIQVQTVINKAILNEEINQRFGAFKDNCFPKPSGGCSCNERDADGNETVAKYSTDAECKVLEVVKRRCGKQGTI
jgi:hypothetical protein